MTTEDRCIFCDVNEETLILKNEDGIVLIDDPVCPGHVLIGGHEHGAGLSDISADTAAAIMRLANQVAKIIVASTGAEKVYVAAIGDKDKHFHVHLVPKMQEDPKLGPYIFGSSGWVSFMRDQVDTSQVEEVTKLIRQQIGQVTNER